MDLVVLGGAVLPLLLPTPLLRWFLLLLLFLPLVHPGIVVIPVVVVIPLVIVLHAVSFARLRELGIPLVLAFLEVLGALDSIRLRAGELVIVVLQRLVVITPARVDLLVVVTAVVVVVVIGHAVLVIGGDVEVVVLALPKGAHVLLRLGHPPCENLVVVRHRRRILREELRGDIGNGGAIEAVLFDTLQLDARVTGAVERHEAASALEILPHGIILKHPSICLPNPLREHHSDVTGRKARLPKREVVVIFQPFQSEGIHFPLYLAPEALVDGLHQLGAILDEKPWQGVHALGHGDVLGVDLRVQVVHEEQTLSLLAVGIAVPFPRPLQPLKVSGPVRPCLWLPKDVHVRVVRCRLRRLRVALSAKYEANIGLRGPHVPRGAHVGRCLGANANLNRCGPLVHRLSGVPDPYHLRTAYLVRGVSICTGEREGHLVEVVAVLRKEPPKPRAEPRVGGEHQDQALMEATHRWNLLRHVRLLRVRAAAARDVHALAKPAHPAS
mmetsp:Transcript_35205/g.86358  ORF Transcript_35205/g.86358 Transcript_35205/m.86358 type:complete len:498 (+) Transcript_35205:486-1979(+)